MSVFDSGFTRRGGLVRPASKSCRFSHHPLRVPKAWHRDFAACGQRSGLLALNLANIFEKLLDQKTFICLRLVTGNTPLRETTQMQFQFASQMWAARPHLGSIFEKLLHRKTFYLPAARFQLPTVLSPYITKNRHRNFFRFHDGFSSALSPLLIHIEEAKPSRICCKMFIQRCPI